MNGHFDLPLCEKTKDDLMYLYGEGAEVIDIEINSEGGELDQALMVTAVMDHLKKHDVKIRTIVTARAASAATLVSSSGTNGERYMYPESQMLVHEPSIVQPALSMSSAEEVRVKKANMDKAVERSLRVYEKNINDDGKYKKLKANMMADNWMSADLCKEIGIVDHATIPDPPPNRKRPEQRVVVWPSMLEALSEGERRIFQKSHS